METAPRNITSSGRLPSESQTVLAASIKRDSSAGGVVCRNSGRHVPQQILPILEADPSGPQTPAESVLEIVNADLWQSRFLASPKPCRIQHPRDGLAAIGKDAVWMNTACSSYD